MKKRLSHQLVGAGILVIALLVVVSDGEHHRTANAVHKAEREFPSPGRLVEIDGRFSPRDLLIGCDGIHFSRLPF